MAPVFVSRLCLRKSIVSFRILYTVAPGRLSGVEPYAARTYILLIRSARPASCIVHEDNWVIWALRYKRAEVLYG